MKWLPLILGGLLGVILREIGGWAPRWASALVRRHARHLAGDDRLAFIDAAERKLATIPGDWTKLIFAGIRLRVVGQPITSRTWTWPSLPRWSIVTIDLVPAIAGGSIMALGISTAFHLPSYATVPFSLLWVALIFNLDRRLAWPSSRLCNWRDVVNAVLRMLPRLVIALFLGMFLAELLLLAMFNREIRFYLATASPHNAGVLDRINALNRLGHEHPSVEAAQLLIIMLIVVIELLPLLVRLIHAKGSAEVPRDRGRHRWGDSR